VRLIFYGTPEFAVLPLRSLLIKGFEVAAVVTQPDRKYGRGRRIVSPPVKVEAMGAGLKIFQPLKIRDPSFFKEISSFSPEVIVVVAYGMILPPEIIHVPEIGCVNVHASLLPKYRGAAPINWALINGEEKTGVTTMFMDEGMDTGPVLLKEEVRINPSDTAGTLSRRLSELGAAVLVKTLEGLENKSLKPVPQTGTVSYAPPLKKTDGLVQWSRQANELSLFVRGMNPWPGAYSFLGDERIKILEAERREGNGETGIIAKVTKDELLVGTGRDLLSLIEVQPSGKPAMNVTAFVQGRRLREGMRFHD
jgi:methionyl-tRNA formyltransferase